MTPLRRVATVYVAVASMAMVANPACIIPPITAGCSQIDALSVFNAKPGTVVSAIGTVNPSHVVTVTVGDVEVEAMVDPIAGVQFVVPDLPPNVYPVIITDVTCSPPAIFGPFDFGIDAL
jgi:hypothetical protein